MHFVIRVEQGVQTSASNGNDNAHAMLALRDFRVDAALAIVVDAIAVSAEYENQVWDLGGEKSLRAMWEQYYDGELCCALLQFHRRENISAHTSLVRAMSIKIPARLMHFSLHAL